MDYGIVSVDVGRSFARPAQVDHAASISSLPASTRTRERSHDTQDRRTTSGSPSAFRTTPLTASPPTLPIGTVGRVQTLYTGGAVIRVASRDVLESKTARTLADCDGVLVGIPFDGLEAA